MNTIYHDITFTGLRNCRVKILHGPPSDSRI